MVARALVVLLLSILGCHEPQCDLETAGTICTIAGSGTQGGPLDGAALDSPLYIPLDIAIGPYGTLWVIDFNNYLVRAIDSDGQIRSVIGNGMVGDSPPPNVSQMPAGDASFNHTTDLVFHGGYLYLAAWHNSRVKRVRIADMVLENFAGAGRRSRYDGNGGPALEASFDLPVSIAIDRDGNVVVMDQANQVVRRIDERGVVDAIAGQCVVENEAPCASPVACPGSNKLTCGDLESCSVETCTPSFGGDGGIPTLARMAQGIGQTEPTGGIAYDHAGCLVLADTRNNRIRRVDPMGIMTTIAGTGARGFAGDGVAALDAQLDFPFDIEIAPDDSIYFTDVQNNCVRKIDPSGTITTAAGQCGAERGFAGDGGPAELALLDRPYGIALYDNKLYIADSYNNRVRAVRLR
jgi:sugar lactone lactonase YvrE